MAVLAQPQCVNREELVTRLGNIPLSRVRLDPPPGSATEADVVAAEQQQNTLCELVDGVLVEKGMGYTESLLAGALIESSGASSSLESSAWSQRPTGRFGSFQDWSAFPTSRLPRGIASLIARCRYRPSPAIVPDLIIEVLSASNTSAEMDRKRAEYFAAGVRLIWEVDPASRIVRVFTPSGAVESSGRVADARWWRCTAGVYPGPGRIVRRAGRARVIK